MFSSVVMRALSHGKYADPGSFVHVSLSSPRAPMETSLVHRFLVWMQTMANLTSQKPLPIAEFLQLLTACLSCPSGVSFLAKANEDSSNMVSWSLGHLDTNHGKAVFPDSNSAFLNV